MITGSNSMSHDYEMIIDNRVGIDLIDLQVFL